MSALVVPETLAFVKIYSATFNTVLILPTNEAFSAFT
jgi:hypothetical protein